MGRYILECYLNFKKGTRHFPIAKEFISKEFKEGIDTAYEELINEE